MGEYFINGQVSEECTLCFGGETVLGFHDL